MMPQALVVGAPVFDALERPEDRDQLVELLHAAFEKQLLDADALSMIEGVMQVSEMQARDVMIRARKWT